MVLQNDDDKIISILQRYFLTSCTLPLKG